LFACTYPWASELRELRLSDPGTNLEASSPNSGGLTRVAMSLAHGATVTVFITEGLLELTLCATTL
jgi:hypothetical protein